jgi:hypothetical protein
MVITTRGGERQALMDKLFEAILMAHPDAVEPPVYASAVSSRSLRTRYGLLSAASEAGLLPPEEWEAIERAHGPSQSEEEHLPAEDGPSATGSAPSSVLDPRNFFDCLGDVPVREGRRGSPQDVKLHYSEELWRKAKALNRGRAVLACTLAHLIALPRFVQGGFDVLLEDNVRAPVECFVERCWEIIDASREWSDKTGIPCHLRYFGWLGSIPNLRWMYDSHIPSRGHICSGQRCTAFPFPTPKDIEADMGKKGTQCLIPTASQSRNHVSDDDERDGEAPGERAPGGNAVWGSYGYYVSQEGYQLFLNALKNDVGAMLRKSKRARYYTVKPIDKILPRLILELSAKNPNDAAAVVHLSSRPAVFRAPMLTSRIHVKYDPEFCKSTEFQLGRSGLTWKDLWLSANESDAVGHHEKTGVWVAVAAPEDWRGSAIVADEPGGEKVAIQL